MATLVAVESSAGVALAADTRVVEGGTVRSDRAGRTFDLDGAIAGAVGPQGDVDAFERALTRAVDAYEIKHGRSVGIDRLGRMAARDAEEAGVHGAVAARDDQGRSQLREIGAEGAVLDAEAVAVGSGAETALGHLEAAERDDEDLEDLVRDALGAALERDPATGGEIEVEFLPTETA